MSETPYDIIERGREWAYETRMGMMLGFPQSAVLVTAHDIAPPAANPLWTRCMLGVREAERDRRRRAKRPPVVYRSP